MFVTHHLLVVKYISQRVAVMYLGKIVEIADTKDLFTKPVHPYTHALLSAIPIPELKGKRQRIVLAGDVPSPINPPDGCRFHTRCPFAIDRCLREEPLLESVGPGHLAACHRKRDMDKLISDRFGQNRSGQTAYKMIFAPFAVCRFNVERFWVQRSRFKGSEPHSVQAVYLEA